LLSVSPSRSGLHRFMNIYEFAIFYAHIYEPFTAQDITGYHGQLLYGIYMEWTTLVQWMKGLYKWPWGMGLARIEDI